jgi:protocatechuate 3,4-dioxygenase beta subunit
MDNDDALVGRLIGRRDAVRLLALGGAGLVVGCDRGPGPAPAVAAAAARGTLPGCLVRPELTVGPFFVDRQLERSDIRGEPATGALRPGTPLALTFRVADVGAAGCVPLAGAMVDVWQCDAAGAYSGVSDARAGVDAAGQRFLRGYQVTAADGTARFLTLYPGWYPGRAVHLHFKIRTPASAALADAGGVYEFTSQLFFDDALTDRVFAAAPYAARGRRDTANAGDGIYREVGDRLLLAVSPQGDAYAGTFAVGLDLSDAAVGRADRMGGPVGPPPRG